MQYLLLIYGPADSMGTAGSAETDHTPWNEYTDWLAAQGILRGGEALAHVSTATTVRVRDGKHLVTDGPFAETREVLGGYYVLEADDLDTAIEAAKRCPAASFGSIELRPIVEMGVPDADAAAAAASAGAR